MKVVAENIKLAGIGILVSVGIGLALCVEVQALPTNTATTAKGAAKSSALRLAEIQVWGLACMGCLRRMERVLQTTPGVLRAFATPNGNGKGATVRMVYDSAVAKFPDLLHVIDRTTKTYKVRSDAPTTGPPYTIHVNDPVGDPVSETETSKKQR